MARIAVIDVGTVSVRLAVATFDRGKVRSLEKLTRICDLGEGVAATRRITNAAIMRVVQCVDDYLTKAREAGAESVVCTLTSAARDATNTVDLLSQLSALGIIPQVIPGEVEGRLTFLGVASDFPGTRLLVADSGGGSIEFALGSLSKRGTVALDFVRSINIGARRMTDRFLSKTDPPTADELAQAHEACRLELADVSTRLADTINSPERLVVCGGTATSMVAMHLGLEPYDPSRVHLHVLTRLDVRVLEDRLSRMSVARRRQVKGLQEKRAPIILGGVVVIAETMDALGFDRMTVSESDLLYGLAHVTGTLQTGGVSPIGWSPTIMPLG